MISNPSRSPANAPHHRHRLYQRRAGLLGRVDPVDVGSVGQRVGHDGEVLQGRRAVQQRPGMETAQVLVRL